MLKLNRVITIESIISAFNATLENDFYYSGERHNFWELVYVCDGKICAAEDEKIYELNPGNVVFHMPMEFHRLWSAGNTSPTIIIISFSAFGDSFSKLGDGIFTLDGEMEKSLKNALDLINQCILFDDDIQNQFASNTLENILLTLLRKQIPVSRQKKTIGTQNYKAILKVMNDNLEKSLSADRIAKLCGLSLSNLKKTFKKYSGMGVMEYYNSLKITKAMEMINDDIPMYEISEKLGFSSPNYFSDSFKRQCKMTPTEYKKLYGSIITAPAESDRK